MVSRFFFLFPVHFKNRLMFNKKTPAVTFILAILAAQFLTGCAKKNNTDKRLMSFNNSQFIEGLYTRVQTDSPREVFNYIFSSLPDEVTVYPLEPTRAGQAWSKCSREERCAGPART